MAPVNQSNTARVVTGNFTAPPKYTPKTEEPAWAKFLPPGVSLPPGYRIRASRKGPTGVITLWRQIDNERVPNSTKVVVDPSWSKERAIKAIQKAMTKGEEILKTISEEGEYHRAIFPSIKTFFNAEWDKTEEGSDERKELSKVKPFVEAHGSTRIDKFDDDDAAAWIKLRLKTNSEKGVPFAPGTVRLEATLIRSLLFRKAMKKQKGKHAARWPRLRFDPWLDVKLPEKSVRTRTISIEEQRRILAVCSPEFQRFLLFDLGTGLRRQTMVGMWASDVTRNQDGIGQVYVRPEIAKRKKAHTVPGVHEDVMRIYDEQIAALGLDPQADVKLWSFSYQAYGRFLKLACEAAGISKPLPTPHDWRRTYGSRMCDLTPNMKDVQESYGHADLETTNAHYNHKLRRALAQKVSQFDLGVGTADPEPSSFEVVTKVGTRVGKGGAGQRKLQELRAKSGA